MNPEISISIVNTNNIKQTIDCLRSVFKQSKNHRLEVFVVNNACTDGSSALIASEFPQVNQINNQKVEGFSTNNNQALSLSTGNYLMLLNDDTIVQESAFEHMHSFLENNLDVGVVGATLFNEDGSYQESGFYLPHPILDGFRPLLSWIRKIKIVSDEPLEVGRVCGACMMVRRDVINEVGLLDTDFDPIYSEEVDWCRRIKRAGWRIFLLPKAKVIHFGSQTMDREPLEKILRLYGKKALYYRKNHSSRGVWMFKISLWFSSLIKLVSWMMIFIFKKDIASKKIFSHYHICRNALSL